MKPPALLACLLLLAPVAAAEIPSSIRERLSAAGLPAESLAFIVQRADGRIVAAHTPDTPMQPASTLKVLTSLVALETLGPAWQGRSELLASGRIEGGVLHGDLVLRGGGDVDLDAPAFETMLRRARLQGVREIRGDLLLDRAAFDPPRTDIGVPPFDEWPEMRYNVIPDALSLNMNLVRVYIASDTHSTRVSLAPELEGVSVKPAFTLVDGSCDDWEDDGLAPQVRHLPRGTLEITLHGAYPRDCMSSTSINVIDRTEFAERLFRATWKRLGGKFRGRARDAAAPEGAKRLASHRARPLSIVVHDIDKHSDNPTARVAYLMLGAGAPAQAGEPTAQRSERVVREWLERKGIDARGLVLENGSGLSRKERIAPATLAGVLRAGLESPWAPEFAASLPIAGVDGGVRDRLAGTTAGTARLKTGTLRDASALAGYLKDASGATLVISAMINDPAAKKDVARPILDALVEWVLSTGSSGTRP